MADTRALIPRDPTQPAPIPTDVDPPTPPAVIVTDDPAPTVTAPPPVRPQAWAGWPTEWPTPPWSGQLETLTDIAWACLDLNSSVAASMPPYLVGASPNLDTSWLNNPDPDRYTSWEEFFKQCWWDFQACGEAIIVCTARYGSGWPARFHCVPPWTVDIELDAAGTRRYRIGQMPIPRDDVLHVRYSGTTQLPHGVGALEVGRGRVITANLCARYLSNLMAAGGAPTTTLVHPGELTAEQAAALQDQWVTARMSSMGLPAVLSGGLDFRATALSPSELALSELAGMTEARIAVLLRVPPYLVGLPQSSDSLVYNTAALTLDYHWRAHLRPLARPIMAALSNWAVPYGTTVELDRDAYVQPGPYERAQTWQILTSIGVLTARQVADIERYVFEGPAAVAAMEGVSDE